MAVVTFQNISFSYDSMSKVLFQQVNILLNNGWTGVVGPNGSGKTTFLKLATGILEPGFGSVQAPGDSLYCEQRTDTPGALEAAFLDATDGGAARFRGILGIEDDWIARWGTLSHGERKRMQIGASLWSEPVLLAVDEPTNHLDVEAKEMVLQALHSFRGIGLLVSHDRNLLDTLCSHTLIITESGFDYRDGSFTSAWDQQKRETDEKRQNYLNEKRDLERLKKEEHRRRALAASQQARRSKRGIPIKDHDARFKKNRARLSGKDGVGGKLLRQMDGRIHQSEERVFSLVPEKVRKTGIRLAGSVSNRDALFATAPGMLELGGGKELEYPELIIHPDSRIGLTGNNGTGKSTLVSHIVRNCRVPNDRLIYIPQELTVDRTKELHREVRSLSNADLGAVMSVVSRLGSDPGRVIESQIPSPGESRKLLLALGISRTPELIVMDEPTNHMDIPSMENVESALNDVDCALLLVSHDIRFINNLTGRRWHISSVAADLCYKLEIQA